MEKIKQICVQCIVLLGLSHFSIAQSSPLSTQELVVCNDPIVEMLDSLVTLNNVIRYNNSLSLASNTTGNSKEIPFVADDTYRERISKINTPIPLVYNEQVKNYIELYAVKRRELTARVLGLSQLYFPLFEESLDKEGLPLEFKYLSIVESALNPTAVSRVGATGIWQFMLNTGKLYNLKVNSFTDDRRDPIKATNAACQYFKDMYEIYHDWLLVIAAYNCGAGNVNRAIIRSGGKTNFWEINRYLPGETRGYVPAFIAVCYVMNYAAEHNIYPVAPAFSYFEVDTLRINQKTTLSKIANNIDLPLDVVYYLNPTYKKGIIPQSETPQVLRLPANKISDFLANENKIYEDVSEPAPVLAVLKYKKGETESYDYTLKKIKTTHKVKKGETLSFLADLYNCSTADIKKENRLRSSKLHVGQKLRVTAYVKIRTEPKIENTETASAKTTDDSTALATNGGVSSADNADSTKSTEEASTETANADNAKAPKYIYHLVQPGDTLWNIARKYEGATVEQIIELNNITDKKALKTGIKLKVKVS